MRSPPTIVSRRDDCESLSGLLLETFCSYHRVSVWSPGDRKFSYSKGVVLFHEKKCPFTFSPFRKIRIRIAISTYSYKNGIQIFLVIQLSSDGRGSDILGKVVRPILGQRESIDYPRRGFIRCHFSHVLLRNLSPRGPYK